MDHRLIIRLASVSLAAALTFSTSHAEWRDDLPSAKPVGQGEMRWFGLRLYRADLFSADGRYDPQQPFALALTYARTLQAERIVQASLDEMQKLGAPTARFGAWRDAMRRAFVDVREGDVLTGVYLPNKGARFYFGDKLTASIDDPEFARWFFAIWLDPHTSEPRLRRALIGGGP